ncbi:hypothetical protein [Kitasatospora sp. NPDC093806]|uniref:hypothetical protein n=1 Tax=Kitasatospora sp. NPDC093806 TaxID=3155075 RepID=UPI0034296ACB
MSDAFTVITDHILLRCGRGPICAHVGDVQSCTMKKHSTYQELRSQVRLGRSKSTASLRLWESVVTLAREGEMQHREKWLMIALDLLTPYFKGWSKELARNWNYEVSDIRSAMIEGLLTAWSSADDGTPPKKLQEIMMSNAFASARSLVNSGSSETCTDSVDIFIPESGHENMPALRPSTIIDVGTVRDPDANERIRGERIGSLLQRMGAMDHATGLHSMLRDGRRDETSAPPIAPAQVGRSWVDGRNLYYRISDLLPQHIGFSKAASTLGLSEAQASRKARDGSLSFRILWAGNTRVVSVKSLMHTLGIQDSIVHPDDVENGASLIRGGQGFNNLVHRDRDRGTS